MVMYKDQKKLGLDDEEVHNIEPKQTVIKNNKGLTGIKPTPGEIPKVEKKKPVKVQYIG